MSLSDTTPTPELHFSYVNYIAVIVTVSAFILILTIMIVICSCTHCCEEKKPSEQSEITKEMTDKLIPPIFYTDADPLRMGDLHEKISL